MQQKAAEEFLHAEGHQTLLVLVSRIPPPEGYAALLAGDQTMVGDGDAVCVATEIAECMFGASEGPHVKLFGQLCFRRLSEPGACGSLKRSCPSLRGSGVTVNWHRYR